MQILETPRLTLRYITIRDTDALMPILGDREVMRYSIIGVHDRKKIRQFIEQRLLSYLECGFGLYGLINRENNQLIGYCGFFVQTVEQQKEVEIGYRLARQYWGKGLATEAAQAVLKYGRERFNFKRFICLIDPENIRSIRVAQKLGMKLEKNIIYYGLNVAMYSINYDK
ncbi:GNAT family N-acetyltransferase [Pleurocapsales cyanobacterium LEGE 10410]|nr:GNAT family N-acetyltransferase [Pleurocapsales cyanobacterium LEGE 10410]